MYAYMYVSVSKVFLMKIQKHATVHIPVPKYKRKIINNKSLAVSYPNNFSIYKFAINLDG